MTISNLKIFLKMNLYLVHFHFFFKFNSLKTILIARTKMVITYIPLLRIILKATATNNPITEVKCKFFKQRNKIIKVINNIVKNSSKLLAFENKHLLISVSVLSRWWPNFLIKYNSLLKIFMSLIPPKPCCKCFI